MNALRKLLQRKGVKLDLVSMEGGVAAASREACTTKANENGDCWVKTCAVMGACSGTSCNSKSGGDCLAQTCEHASCSGASCSNNAGTVNCGSGSATCAGNSCSNDACTSRSCHALTCRNQSNGACNAKVCSSRV